MSKKNAAKKKTTGFDIMYRVVAAVLALAMFPAMYFSTLVYYEIDHTNLSAIITKITGKEDPGFTYGEISLQEIVNGDTMISSFTDGDFSIKDAFANDVYLPVIIAAVLLALALVVGLVILGFAAFSNMQKVILGLSSGGFLLTVASYISFTNFFANPLINGDITLNQLFNTQSSILTTIISAAGKFSSVHLDTAFFAVMFLMLGILIWTVAVMIVNHGEKNDVPQKKNA